MDPQLTDLPLRDIHAGYQPQWWPPAPGWWVLAALALIALIVLAIRLYKRYRRWRYRQALMAEMDGLLARFNASQNSAQLVADTGTLLRRLIVHAAGRRQAASLTGQQWSDLLKEVNPDGSLGETCDQLATAPYQPQASVDTGQLHQLVMLWIERVSQEAKHV
jgi:hypothetical protein